MDYTKTSQGAQVDNTTDTTITSSIFPNASSSQDYDQAFYERVRAMLDASPPEVVAAFWSRVGANFRKWTPEERAAHRALAREASW